MRKCARHQHSCSKLRRPAGAVPLWITLCALLRVRSQHTDAVGIHGDAGTSFTQLDEAHSDKRRMAATPAFVISGKDERWEHMRSVLATLHVSAERVWPPKPSLHLAKEMYAFHDYDRHANMTDEHHQRYMSLLVAWRHVLSHIAHHPDLGPDEWALAFEDDISLHDNLTLSAARAAILRGFSLARTEGWLYLGLCQPGGQGKCWESTAVSHDGVEFAKCTGVCSHSLAFTKRKADTMLADMHASMKSFMDIWGSYPGGHSIDQMLKQHSTDRNGTWTVGSNLKYQPRPSDDLNIGVFFQDRDQLPSTIMQRRMMRRMMRATWWP